MREFTSIVLAGETGNVAKVGVIHQITGSVSFAADVNKSELIHAGTGRDISSVPFFGNVIIPALSFVISSDELSTVNLPDVEIPGIAKELLLENIPKGLKGKFLVDLGSAIGLDADYSDDTLTITVYTIFCFFVT